MMSPHVFDENRLFFLINYFRSSFFGTKLDVEQFWKDYAVFVLL